MRSNSEEDDGPDMLGSQEVCLRGCPSGRRRGRSTQKTVSLFLCLILWPKSHLRGPWCIHNETKPSLRDKRVQAARSPFSRDWENVKYLAQRYKASKQQVQGLNLGDFIKNLFTVQMKFKYMKIHALVECQCGRGNISKQWGTLGQLALWGKNSRSLPHTINKFEKS